jgi:hypothetical protein
MVSELLPIQSINSVDVVDSRLIAIELGIQHKNLIEMVRKYQDRLEKRGVLTFETEKPNKSSSGGRPETFCWLNLWFSNSPAKTPPPLGSMKTTLPFLDATRTSDVTASQTKRLFLPPLISLISYYSPSVIVVIASLDVPIFLFYIFLVYH